MSADLTATGNWRVATPKTPPPPPPKRPAPRPQFVKLPDEFGAMTYVNPFRVAVIAVVSDTSGCQVGVQVGDRHYSTSAMPLEQAETVLLAVLAACRGES